MSDELNAAADRIIDTEEYCLSEYRVEEHDDPEWLQRINDRLAVARAYRAEHDQTLVDSAWLESKLGPRSGMDQYSTLVDPPRWFVASGEIYIQHGSRDYRVDNRSRGDVLGLLRWLKWEGSDHV